MKTRITALLAVLAVLGVTFAAIASAAVVSQGKLSSFSYTKSTKTGHLTIKGKKKTKFRVPASADCGVDKGQSGDQIPCKSLGKSAYAGKPVRVTSTKAADGTRVASLVVVVLH